MVLPNSSESRSDGQNKHVPLSSVLLVHHHSHVLYIASAGSVTPFLEGRMQRRLTTMQTNGSARHGTMTLRD